MQTKDAARRGVLNLRVGELVEVRSAAEILATLDDKGELDALPFMPEMLQYCGQQLRVYKVAHKACDTITYSGLRRMRDAVHLTGARCDGQAHGGCQTACLIYWKEAWLKRVNPVHNGEVTDESGPSRCTLPLVEANTTKDRAPNGAEVFSCQATELLRAAPERLPLRDLGQHAQDLRSGNVGLWTMLRTIGVGVFDRIQRRSTRVLPRWLWFRDGLRWGFLRGTATKTPTGRTDLQPGELVRVKPKEEILKTVNGGLLNRGLSFDHEMLRYCGHEARVLRRVDQVIDEKTGKMLHLKNPCIILEETICTGAYNASCPRAFYAFWREIWLDRV
jgi:hypothetical protein